jgi:HAMP domain-containing protein
MKQAQAIPIRQLVIIVFIFFLLITVSLIGYIVFSNWMSSSESHTEQMAANMNKEVSAQVDQFISLPLHINEVNQRLISNGIVNLYNELEREKYMVGVLQAHDGEILYSFSYGSETGEYYGARRNEHNEIEIMRNNSATNGHSWYYSLKPDLTAGERVVVTGKFDPRERDWYQAAKKEQKPVFSPIYKHFVMDDLAVSAAYPIYNWDGVLQGVLGAHITLSRIDHYLQEIVQEKEALALIVEQKTGELVANSLGLKNFSYSADGSIERLRIDDINNNTVRQAYEHYRISGDNTFKLELEKQAYYIKLSQYHKEGVEWLLITAIPESLFTAGIYRNIRISAGLTIIALLLSIAIYFLLTRRLMHPINDLIASTERFSEGDLTHRAKIFRNDEIGIVSEAFNRMAQTIDELVNDLEERVKERTLELAASNQALTFGFYGLFKKLTSLDSISGLTLETMLTCIFALAYLIYLGAAGLGSFHFSWTAQSGLLFGAGVVTAVPLLLFGAGAQSLPLFVLGFLQYISPTMTLLLGTLIYHEPFTRGHLLSFAIICIALIIFSLSKSKMLTQMEERILSLRQKSAELKRPG